MVPFKFLLASLVVLVVAFSSTLFADQLFGGYSAVNSTSSSTLSGVRASPSSTTGVFEAPPLSSQGGVSATTSEKLASSTLPSLDATQTSSISQRQPSLVSPTAKPSSQTIETENADLIAVSRDLRAALVNILCLAPAGTGLSSISGSGVMVGSGGYILTDAHVAQYFLFADRGVECTIRTGDPARDAYHAELAYLSSKWVTNNSTVLTESAPLGTGEEDFALLAITGGVTPLALPTSFPGVPFAYTAPSIGAPVVIGSYAAQFLSFSQVVSSLSPTIAYGSIKNIFTFGSTTADVAALGGSAAAQEGSSGGGVVSASGALVADITTSSVTGNTATRSLSAITSSYIRREYETETGTSLDTLLVTPPAEAVADFAPQAAQLEATLVSANHLGF